MTFLFMSEVSFHFTDQWMLSDGFAAVAEYLKKAIKRCSDA